MSGHEHDRDRELEQRLDQALDALASEQSPDLAEDDDQEFLELLDAARVARGLREPVWPADDFASDLSARLTSQLTEEVGPARHKNGYRPVDPPSIVVARRRRGRALLVPIAALLRVLGSGVVAGMVVGLVVGGIGGRIAMYISGQLYLREHPRSIIITESSGQPVGSFSWSGTFDLLMEGMFTGIFGGLLYVVIRRWLPGSPRVHGIVFGLFLLAVAGSMTITSDNQDFARIGPAWLNISMFALIFLLFGLLVVPLANRILRLTTSFEPSGRRVPAWRRLAAILVLPAGVLGTFLTTFMILMSTVFVGSEIASMPDNGVSITGLVIVLTIALVVVVLPITSALASQMATPLASRIPWPGGPSVEQRRATLAHYARLALAGALALGLVLTLSNVVRILGAG